MPTDEQVIEIRNQADALLHSDPSIDRWEHALTIAQAYQIAALVNVTEKLDKVVHRIDMLDPADPYFDGSED